MPPHFDENFLEPSSLYRFSDSCKNFWICHRSIRLHCWTSST